jgi:hypothetical protein
LGAIFVAARAVSRHQDASFCGDDRDSDAARRSLDTKLSLRRDDLPVS